MSEEHPSPEGPDSPAETPTAETPSATSPESEAAPTTAGLTAPAQAQAPSPSPSPSSRHFLVPKWLTFVVASLVLVGIGFAIGWFAAPGDSGRSRPAEMRGLPNRLPFGGRRPFANGSGSAYLGVATRAGTDGAQIAQIAGGSPAADAGLKVGDVITKVDDQSVSGPAQLVQRVLAHNAGQQVTITYTRSGKTATAKVTLGDRSTRQGPQGAPPALEAPAPSVAPAS